MDPIRRRKRKRERRRESEAQTSMVIQQQPGEATVQKPRREDSAKPTQRTEAQAEQAKWREKRVRL